MDSFDDVSRSVAAFVLSLRPSAIGCRIVIDIHDGTGTASDTLTVPLIHASDDKQTHALIVLGKLRPGEYMSAKSLAAELDLEPRGGHFNGIVRELKRADKIESHPTHGYRLLQGKG